MMTKRELVLACAALALASTPALAAGSLTVTYMESGTYDVAAKKLAAEFGKEKGVEVNVVAFPWAVLRQNNTTDLISGAGQYQVMSGGYYLADVYANFAPLTDQIAKADYAKGMIPGLMEPGRSEWFEGKQIGIPYGIDAYGLMVNSEILAKAGVKPSFANWSEVLSACAKISQAAPGVACFSHSTGNPEQIGAFFFAEYAGTYVTKEGTYQLETDKAVAAASILPELWKNLPEGGKALSFDEAETLFAQGKSAMLVDWPSFSTKMLDDPARSQIVGKWTMAPFPGQGFPWLSLWQQFIPNTAPDKDLAFEWIRTFAGEANAKSNMVEHGINSVWLSTYEDTELKAKFAHYWPVMVEGFSRAKNPPLSGESQDFLTNTLVEIATGQVTAADGIAKVNAKWATLPVPSALLGAAAGSGLQAK